MEKTNNERLAVMEEKLIQNDKDHAEIIEKTKENSEGIKTISKKIDSLPSKLKNEFSSKWVEKMMYAFIVGIIGYLSYRVIDLLIK
jgi:type III secretory pathway component EscR